MMIRNLIEWLRGGIARVRIDPAKDYILFVDPTRVDLERLSELEIVLPNVRIVPAIRPAGGRVRDLMALVESHAR